MSTLKFYHSPVSPPSRFVKAILTLGNIPHELIIIDLLKQENKTEEYGKINPNKTVPALVDGDVKLWESHAIGKYLCDKVRHTYIFQEIDKFTYTNFCSMQAMSQRTGIPVMIPPLDVKLINGLTGVATPLSLLSVKCTAPRFWASNFTKTRKSMRLSMKLQTRSFRPRWIALKRTLLKATASSPAGLNQPSRTSASLLRS